MKKVNVALVGVGGHGLTIRKAVKLCPRINVVAVYDINKSLAEEASKEFGCEKFSNYDELLELRDINAVIIATPNHLHFEQAYKALKKGKDVFIEKPITVKVDEARKLVRLARSEKLILQVGHNTRKRKVFRKAKEILDSGKLGKVIFFEANISMKTGLGRFPRWKADKSKCPLLPMTQLGIHFVDVIYYLLGEITDVFAHGRKSVLKVEDTVIAALKLSSGVIGVLSSSYVTGDAYEFKIYGTDAFMNCYVDRVELWQGDKDKPEVFILVEDIDSYLEEVSEFAECVIHRRNPEVDGYIGMKNLKVVEAMIESIAKKTAVRV
ncbi:Predicted dehydrogenase [Candidatus Thermokryptus mobilis]|uniref:Predicted dehydrogenase n=1 Tax=Candidatus Thermokryptus mobilis TaxID=1643428 RepID=A0A0S4NCE1_9BACT|nr:Gfo/Idh/MocA family oxidoreductase [Candidatus Thermokryptus mobilis]CUU07935.1 Predicted dehydrogenase [Candidatus Thermokryptus mobilis]